MTCKKTKIYQDHIQNIIEIEGLGYAQDSTPKSIFLLEKGGKTDLKTVKDWLQGLPSIVNILFWDQDITVWQEKNGVKMDVEDYWNNCASAFYLLYLV